MAGVSDPSRFAGFDEEELVALVEDLWSHRGYQTRVRTADAESFVLVKRRDGPGDGPDTELVWIAGEATVSPSGIDRLRATAREVGASDACVVTVGDGTVDESALRSDDVRHLAESDLVDAFEDAGMTDRLPEAEDDVGQLGDGPDHPFPGDGDGGPSGDDHHGDVSEDDGVLGGPMGTSIDEPGEDESTTDGVSAGERSARDESPGGTSFEGKPGVGDGRSDGPSIDGGTREVDGSYWDGVTTAAAEGGEPEQGWSGTTRGHGSRGESSDEGWDGQTNFGGHGPTREQ